MSIFAYGDFRHFVYDAARQIEREKQPQIVEALRIHQPVAGGQGVLDIKTTERNGKVVAVLPVKDGEELMIITGGGKIQRFLIDDVRAVGRNTQGVRLMKLKSDVVVAANTVPPEREIDEAKEIIGVEKNPPAETASPFEDTDEEYSEEIDEETDETEDGAEE